MNRDKELTYEVLNEETVLDAYVYKLVRSHRRSYAGKTMEVHTIAPPDWVQVIPVIKNDQGEDCFIMVRQFRHGIKKVLTEFPGGMVDPGETPLESASRELLEETGYEAGQIIHIGSANPNPAIMSNTTHAFLAIDLKSVAGQDLDEHESIHVQLIPISEVEKNMGIGDFNHGIMLMALWWYKKYKNSL